MDTVNYEIESNDVWQDATLVAGDGTVIGGQIKRESYIDDEGATVDLMDFDWFKFEVVNLADGTKSFDLEFDSPIESDDTADVADSFGIGVFTSDFELASVYWTDNDISGTFSTPTDGTYYVVIVSDEYSEEDGQSLQYGLTLKQSDTYAEVESNDTFETANAATFGRTYAGQMRQWGDIDYFQYSVGAPGLVSIDFDCAGPFTPNVSNTAVYQIVVVEALTGNLITKYFTNDDVPNFDFYAQSAGDYYVGVTHGGSWAAADYHLKVTSTGDSATSDPEPTSFTGGAGDDNLLGTTGDDTIDGLAGIDVMYGSLGNDIYLVDNKNDKVFESFGEGSDTVMSTVDLTLYANVEKLMLSGTALKAKGNTDNNTLIGNELDNTLEGLAGDDVLDGGVGADKMYGGTGKDTYYIDNALDKIDESGNDTDTIITSIDILELNGDIENVVLAGETVQVIGNSLANQITGNDGFNNIQGGKGNDVIYGVGGNDDLRGGKGSDTIYSGDGHDAIVFDVSLIQGEFDHIMDFEGGTDKLWLSRSIYKKLATGSVSDDNILQVATTTGENLGALLAGQDANDFLIYLDYLGASGYLFYDADAWGPEGLQVIARLVGSGETAMTPGLVGSDLFVF